MIAFYSLKSVMRKLAGFRFKILSPLRTMFMAMCMLSLCGSDLNAEIVELHTPKDIENVGNNEGQAIEMLNRLTTDSLFRKGTNHIIREPAAPDSAMRCFMTAISRIERQREDTAAMRAIAKCLINTAYVYSSFFKDPAEAYSYLLKAKEYCRDYGFNDILAHVYMNIGFCFHSDKIKNSISSPGDESGDSRRYLKLAFDMAEESGNYEVMSYALYNMTNEFHPDEAESMREYLRRYLSADIPDSEKSRPYMEALSNGMLEYIDGNTDKARCYFNKLDTVEVPLELGIYRMQEYGRLMTSFTYEREGDWRKAAEILSALLESARRRNDMESEMSMNGNLYLLYSRQGDKKLMDKYLLDYYKTRERLATASGSLVSMGEAELRDNIGKYERELQLSQIRESRNRIFFTAAIIVGVCIIATLVVMLYFSRKRRHYINSLYEKHLQLTDSKNLSAVGLCASHEMKTGEETVEEKRIVHADGLPTDNLASSAGISASSSSERNLMRAVSDILQNSPMVFEQDFQMARLCAEVGSNVTYVSKAVNSCFGKPFKTVLTERRIAEACRRFDNPEENGRYTVEAICAEVGFRSRAAFSVAFKNVTGLTPTEYRLAARRYMPPQN